MLRNFCAFSFSFAKKFYVNTMNDIQTFSPTLLSGEVKIRYRKVCFLIHKNIFYLSTKIDLPFGVQLYNKNNDNVF